MPFPALRRAGRLLRFGALHLLGGSLHGVGLVLTRRCNLCCPYCGVIQSELASRRHELAPEDWMDIVDRFVAHGRLHFIFTGGEPLLYDGLERLLRHTADAALTSLITNATLLTPDSFRRLRHLDYLTFSWDTLAKNQGQEASGAGLEKNPSHLLPLIAEQCRIHGITPSAIVTVTAANLHEIEPIILELHDHGISSLLSLIHSGDPTEEVTPQLDGETSNRAAERRGWDFRARAEGLDFRHDASLAALEALARRLLVLKRQGIAISESDAFIAGMRGYAEGSFQMDCPAADDFFTVDVDGRIKACHDTPASAIDARTWRDYEAMRQAVRQTVRPGCNCYYDCYFEARNTPSQTLLRYLRRASPGGTGHRTRGSALRRVAARLRRSSWPKGV